MTMAAPEPQGLSFSVVALSWSELYNETIQ